MFPVPMSCFSHLGHWLVLEATVVMQSKIALCVIGAGPVNESFQNGLLSEQTGMGNVCVIGRTQ